MPNGRPNSGPEGALPREVVPDPGRVVAVSVRQHVNIALVLLVRPSDPTVWDHLTVPSSLLRVEDAVLLAVAESSDRPCLRTGGVWPQLPGPGDERSDVSAVENTNRTTEGGTR